MIHKLNIYICNVEKILRVNLKANHAYVKLYALIASLIYEGFVIIILKFIYMNSAIWLVIHDLKVKFAQTKFDSLPKVI